MINSPHRKRRHTIVRLPLIALFCVSVSLPASLPAGAQLSGDSKAPIDIKADKSVYRGGTTVLTGQVKIVQKGAELTADKVTIFRAEQTGSDNNPVKLGNINRIIAEGRFTYKTDEQTLTGQKGVYERQKNTITVTGKVRFTNKNGNAVEGNKMVYQLNSKKVRVVGKCTGRNCGKDGRVNITIGGQPQ